MRIYYFGELIQDSNGNKVNETKTTKTEESEIKQTTFNFDAEQTVKKSRTLGMESIGDLLRDLDLNLDVYNPMNSRYTNA